MSTHSMITDAVMLSTFAELQARVTRPKHHLHKKCTVALKTLNMQRIAPHAKIVVCSSALAACASITSRQLLWQPCCLAMAKCLQSGITNPEAEEELARAGIQVVSNRCLMVEHQLAASGASTTSHL